MAIEWGEGRSVMGMWCDSLGLFSSHPMLLFPCSFLVCGRWWSWSLTFIHESNIPQIWAVAYACQHWIDLTSCLFPWPFLRGRINPRFMIAILPGLQNVLLFSVGHDPRNLSMSRMKENTGNFSINEHVFLFSIWDLRTYRLNSVN
jgi:hypothetical protein